MGVPDEYDVRAAGSHNVNGATWNTSSDFGVGTGLLEPFMRVSDNDGNEEAFNTNASPAPLNLGNTAVFNHSLALNRVPVLTFGSLSFRELILDANESNSDPDANFSVDRFNLWLCEEDVGFDPQQVDARTDFEGNVHCALVYDLDDGTTNSDGDKVLATDASSKGSGKSYDYQILIPETNFTAAAGIVGVDLEDCSYAGPDATPCGAWLILDVRMGFTGGDFIVGATFEEVATLPRPWVAVTKTATPDFTRRYNWEIEKSVVPTSIVLFEGQSQNATWTITVSPGDPEFTDEGAQVTGTITIANTSGETVTINSVADAIPGYPGITPSCPGTFPQTLTNNATLVCTYSVVAPNTNPGTHTNTATVAILAAIEGEANPPDAATFTGSADFDFADATPTEIDKNPDVYDDYHTDPEVLIGQADDSPFSFVRNYLCDGAEGTFANNARVDLTPPATDPTDQATLTVDCLDVTVTKTANTTIQREFLWLIEKSVTPAAWELFRGDDGTSTYTVTVTPNGTEDDTWAVSGVITVTGDPNAPVFLQSLSDAIEPGGFTPAVTDCEDNTVAVTLAFPYTLAAGHVLTCDYSQTFTSGTNRTNTARVVAKPTPTGTDKGFSGEAAVDFSTATVDEVNETVHVTDLDDVDGDVGGPQNVEVSNRAAPTVLNYNRTFACDADAGTHNNTATITETGQSDDASVTVVCTIVRVEKNATTSYDRDFNWDIDKQADQTGPLELASGQTFIVNYDVVVTKSAAIDDNHHVTGTIRIAHNNTTVGAVLNSLADVVSGVGGGNASYDCIVNGTTPFTFPGTLAPGDQLRCTYDLDLPDAISRTNTATATQQNHSYNSAGVGTPAGTTDWGSAAVDVTFGEPTNVTDDCAMVDDTYAGGPQDVSICVSQTFEYERSVTAPEGSCTDFNVDNTATVTPSNDVAKSDNISILVDVQCPEGCTLTLGYWKTHNVSFTGGAPPDGNWLNITPFAELSGFFTTANSYPTTGPNSLPAFTWFNVFWTSPKGNAYYSLAHQYMAAKLNILNDADPTEVALAITEAEGLFANLTNTPEYVGDLKGNSTLRKDFIRLAGTLGSYNEGIIGPGHCSEDATSSLTLTR